MKTLFAFDTWNEDSLLKAIFRRGPERAKMNKKKKEEERGMGGGERWNAVKRKIGKSWDHPILWLFGVSMVAFMGVEYSLGMVPPSSPPVDLGFVLTRRLHAALAASPSLNSFLAAVNTVFVGMQTAYILWALLAEERARPTIAALFMFTLRGLLGYSTQLPLPKEFLGSGMDFPVGNVSFFLFFSGHAGGAVISSLDMRRTGRRRMAVGFDVLNCLQALRLLATRGHYTIDLAAGVGAGFLFDVLAGFYADSHCLNVPNDAKCAPHGARDSSAGKS